MDVGIKFYVAWDARKDSIFVGVLPQAEVVR